MGKTRNYKKKALKGKRTRKGGYIFYPGPGDEESFFGKYLGFGKKTPSETVTTIKEESEISTPSDLPPPAPPVEVKGIDTPEPTEVPEKMETIEEVDVEEDEKQEGGKKRRRRKRRAGDYDASDFAKLYGSTSSSSGPKKRGSKEGRKALAPYMGGNDPTITGGDLTKKDFMKSYGMEGPPSSLVSNPKKRGSKEAEQYIKAFGGDDHEPDSPGITGGKRRTRRRKGSKKKHHKKSKKTKKSKKRSKKSKKGRK